jgi:hypothetical protein
MMIQRTIRIAMLFAAACAAAGAVPAGLAAPAAAQYGPTTCKQGFVWREAFAGDFVCVVPAVRSEAAEDNAAAASRRQPGGGAYGPSTCRQGFVWREARPSDHVCVTPNVRARTHQENLEAVARFALYH